jgi:PAS domain S-box-containing protein
MTFRNIKISLKIAVFVLSVTIVSISAVSYTALKPTAQTSNESPVDRFVYTGAILCVFSFLVSMIIAGSLTRPLDSIRFILGMVSRGELPEKSTRKHTDEFGKIQERVEDLVQMLKRNALFAQKVGEGNFDTPFQPASENDSLGIALMDMRNNLLSNDRKEKEHNWIVLGLAEAGNLLRAHDTLENLGEEILRFTIAKVNCIQGAFYVVNDSKLELRNSFAYNRKKYLQKSFAFGEGLVGQAAAEKDLVLRTEIPDNYMSISSGILGDKKPSCILIMPLIANEEVHGVIELAGLSTFDSLQINFIKELSEMLARTIFNITVNERTKMLLAESQSMSNDLKEKQEVLRQNAEEMQASQEELTRSNRKLEEQVEEVNRTRSRMQLLLENASEVITICEGDGTIRYISPSVQTILGYSPADIQGTKDLEHVHPDGREAYLNLFQQLKSNPANRATAQFEYRTSEGTYIWLEATGNNFMSNPAIHGYILNSRDITEHRRAEQEQRMRSKMQALSENSTDLITRLENGLISYINPVIKTYTGREASTFLHKQANDTQLDETVLEKWLSIIEQVKHSGSIITTEMDFPSSLGNRIMQVNAIPEFDAHDILESVLVVSHDVTDRKVIELDIQHKNKKINDSINYARRIQNAILPDSLAIVKALPDSFILYKPRDVVSGDFPWFVQRQDEIYIAAVDCTGHGVPGALLSLIGYFLLNDIVKSRNITDPGKILDLLDEGVTQTLRQDLEDAATKDGMDIALCRINTRTNTVDYAGAHRPLYVMKGGALEEIKGNKFPVGGGLYKNQTDFTTTSVKLNAGDGIYFSSDGFPDQFGGPEGRKFGSKRMRDLIVQLHPKKAVEAGQAFDHAWETWRNDHKQTDDLLLIGVKF